jgi:hypothetical protein
MQFCCFWVHAISLFWVHAISRCLGSTCKCVLWVHTLFAFWVHASALCWVHTLLALLGPHIGCCFGSTLQCVMAPHIAWVLGFMLVLVWCRMSETNYNFVVHTSVRTSRCQLGRTNACGSVFGFYEKVPGPTLKLVPEVGNPAALQIMETGRPRPCVICIAHMASVYRPCMITANFPEC